MIKLDSNIDNETVNYRKENDNDDNDDGYCKYDNNDNHEDINSNIDNYERKMTMSKQAQVRVCQLALPQRPPLGHITYFLLTLSEPLFGVALLAISPFMHT